MRNKIILIAAVAQNGVVGITKTDGTQSLPWTIKDDMKFFKDTTYGHPVIMGRKTYESFGGRLLSGRFNVVMTRDTDYYAKMEMAHKYNLVGLTDFGTVNDVRACLEVVTRNNLFVIGGNQIWKEFLPYATHFYRTKVLANVDGDTYFPEINEDDWTSTVIMTGEQNERNQYPFIIEELVHKNYVVEEILK